MSVQFEEENFIQKNNASQLPLEQRTGSKMGDWLIKAGFAQTPAAANVILIVVAILVFGTSLYFFVFGLRAPSFEKNTIAPQKFPPSLEIKK